MTRGHPDRQPKLGFVYSADADADGGVPIVTQSPPNTQSPKLRWLQAAAEQKCSVKRGTARQFYLAVRPFDTFLHYVNTIRRSITVTQN